MNASRGLSLGICLILLAGCGPLEPDDDCPDDTVEAYCAGGGCPSSPYAAVEQPCDYPQVWRTGGGVIIGIAGGLGGYTYHFRRGELVGVQWWTDTLPAAGECRDDIVVDHGELVADGWTLETLGGNGNRDGCNRATEGIECLPSCTFCPDFEDVRDRCPNDVLDGVGP